jgi:hypothetical protein
MILVGMIGLVYSAQGQKLPDGTQLQLDLKVWDYSLESIPTHHLEECCRRALRGKRNDFPLTAAAVNREWDTLVEELRVQADQHAAQQDNLLKAGHGSLGLMTQAEWKARHNLPAEWKLGDPFPPESDLCGKPVPVKREEVYTCRRCRGARWLNDNKRLVPCDVCGPI